MRNIQNKNNNKRKCIIIDFNFVWLSIKSRALLLLECLGYLVYLCDSAKIERVRAYNFVIAERIYYINVYYLYVLFFGGAASLFFLFMCGGLSGAIYNSCWMEHKKNMLVVNCKKHTIGLILKWIEVYLFSLWLAVN